MPMRLVSASDGRLPKAPAQQRPGSQAAQAHRPRPQPHRPLLPRLLPPHGLDPRRPGGPIPGKATFHDLRHTHATWLARDGISIEILRERLGHASLMTTQKYISATSTIDTTAGKPWPA
jgi:integrase